MTRRVALALFRLWAVVLLATIGLQAAEPVGAPLQREAGSAFSAATADVALASGRRGGIAQVQAIPTPPLPPPYGEVRILAPVILPSPAEHLRPALRAPPPRGRSERLPDLRGPPLA
jgi:hypothetical protein